MCLSSAILVGRDQKVTGYKIFRVIVEGLFFDVYPEMLKTPLVPGILYKDKKKSSIWNDNPNGLAQVYRTGYHFYARLEDVKGVFAVGSPYYKVTRQIWECEFSNLTAVGYQTDFVQKTSFLAAVARQMKLIKRVEITKP